MEDSRSMLEVELTELEDEEGIKNEPQVCGLWDWTGVCPFLRQEVLECGQGLEGRRKDITDLDI